MTAVSFSSLTRNASSGPRWDPELDVLSVVDEAKSLPWPEALRCLKSPFREAKLWPQC